MTNKTPKTKQPKNLSGKIEGMLMLFVIGSISYTTTVIIIGTEGYIPLALTAPQAIFAAFVLAKNFINK